MAQIVGGIMSSHVPAIGRAIARNLQQDPYWQPWFAGFPPVHQWLAEVRPDVAGGGFKKPRVEFFLPKKTPLSGGGPPPCGAARVGGGAR